MNTTEKLAKRLLYLPLDVQEKVLLWLAHRGLKPVSEITVERRGNIISLLRRGISKVSTYSYNSPRTKRIRKWIRDAGLYKATESKYKTSWHIGRDHNRVILSTKVLHKFNYENEVKSGVLLGYPLASAKAYAYNRNLKIGDDKIPVIYPGYVFMDSYLKDKYYTPYIFYAIRTDCVKEDALTAKTWADAIKSDVPVLAKWFEKEVEARRKREGKFEQSIKEMYKRENLTIDEIINEYSRGEQTNKQVFSKALVDFLGAQIGNFLFASMCLKIRRRLSKEEKKDKDFIAVLKKGENLYKPGRLVVGERKKRIELSHWLDK